MSAVVARTVTEAIFSRVMNRVLIREWVAAATVAGIGPPVADATAACAREDGIAAAAGSLANASTAPIEVAVTPRRMSRSRSRLRPLASR